MPKHTLQTSRLAASWDTGLAEPKGDYTGRWGTVGTGTDDRAAIQAKLNAAGQAAGTYQWSELVRRGIKYTLPAGVYIITAPSDGSPSLTIPEGVTADFSQAMIFFDYPAAATGGWSAILVKNSGNLVVPYFMGPSGRVTAPGAPGTSNTNRLYDGVRVLGSNNATTRITAVGASEIKGFQGASIRSIGGWVTRYDGPIVLSSDHGYIASNWPATNVYGYAHGTALPGIIGGVRLHTDAYFDGPYFNGSRAGGYLGVVSGDPTTPHELDYSRSGGHQVYFKSTIFEHFAAYAVRMTGGLVSFTDCAFEEVGLSDQGMVEFDTVQSIMFKNHRINYTGASVPGPAGTNLAPFLPVIIKIGSGIQRFTWEGGYYHNTYSNAKFANGSATVYDVLAPRCDSREFTTDSSMYTPLGRAVSGGYTKALKWGSVWMWPDAAGVLRISTVAPTADTDGVAVGSQT